MPGAVDPTGKKCEIRASDNASPYGKRVSGSFGGIGGFSGGGGLKPSPLNITPATQIRCKRTVRYECCCKGKKSIHFVTQTVDDDFDTAVRSTNPIFVLTGTAPIPIPGLPNSAPGLGLSVSIIQPSDVLRANRLCATRSKNRKPKPFPVAKGIIACP